MKFLLRIITIICYFAPFTFFLVTCNGAFEMRFSYNKLEADSNEQEANELLEVNEIIDSSGQKELKLNDTAITDRVEQSLIEEKKEAPTDSLQRSTDFWDKVIRGILMPTDRSLSGIGAVFYFKNMPGKISIALSLLISMVLLVGFKLIKSQSTQQYLLSVALICLTVFIINSLISQVTLKWGCWTLFGLLILQIMLEVKQNKHKDS